MVGVAFEFDVSFFDNGVATMTNVTTQTSCLLNVIAFAAKSTASIAKETNVGKLLVATFAGKALRMPVGIHCLDNSTHNKFVAFATARSVEYLEVMLAVLASFKLKVDTVLEGQKALCANETFCMPYRATGVNNLLILAKSVATTYTS